jgi:hypothetical protein
VRDGFHQCSSFEPKIKEGLPGKAGSIHIIATSFGVGGKGFKSDADEGGQKGRQGSARRGKGKRRVVFQD